ncbi:M6 family metalloprotease domain-containing protein [Rheinheimera riviphila]|uniref:M6 family metalloprotease domain-containing protein n=2 Tax=Rheinheimera riviphila TaxID=1834037 RepID=A0A437QIN9_9GAMM|nr:M6 family metalloprotease domain-containing protein [Rheinheimera riviphila]
MMKIHLPGLALALSFVLPVSQAAVPFVDHPLQFRQPNGQKLTIYLSGNNYFAEQRLADGKLVVYDNNLKGYAYAVVSANGSALQSTGQLAQPPIGSKQSTPGLLQNQQPGLSPAAKAALVKQAQQQLLGNEEPHQHGPQHLTDGSPKAADDVPMALPATVRGLTVIIQFPNQTGTISKTQVESFLNDLTYTGFGNAQSVRGYFQQVSGSKLDYQNTVTRYYTAKKNKSYYTDNSLSSSVRSQELISEALNWLEYTEGFNFSTLTTNSSKQILGLNFFYAGEADSAWSKGLWPHMGGLSPRFCADGVCTSLYQITNMGTNMAIGTFIHESGHLLLGWPDLYDYDGSSEGSVAAFCVMGYGAIGVQNKFKPTPPVGVFRHLAGWDTVTELNPALNSQAPTGQLSHTSGARQLYRWGNPANTKEAFYIEAVHQSGQNQYQPDQGLAIWHVDPSGSNSNEWKPYIQMEHADGKRDPENKRNRSDATDLYDGNTTAEFNKIFPNALTSRGTNALWWNGSDSGLNISQISSPASTINFTLAAASAGDTYSGTLAVGAQAIVPNNSYFQYNGGTLRLTLSAATGTNFDLYLQRWNGSSWANVAQSTASNSNESLSYAASNGYYRALVRSVTGAGSYQLNIRK